MKTTFVTLELTTDELFDLAYALEESIERHIKDCCLSEEYTRNDIKAECDLLEHFVRYHSYTLHATGEGWTEYKTFDSVEEWVKALFAKKHAETQPTHPPYPLP